MISFIYEIGIVMFLLFGLFIADENVLYIILKSITWPVYVVYYTAMLLVYNVEAFKKDK